MDYKIQRRWRQRERQKNNRFNKQNNNFARASHFFVYFFPIFARPRRGNALFRVLWRTLTRNDEILFHFLSLDMLLEIQLQEGLPTFDKVSR